MFDTSCFLLVSRRVEEVCREKKLQFVGEVWEVGNECLGSVTNTFNRRNLDDHGRPRRHLAIEKEGSNIILE